MVERLTEVPFFARKKLRILLAAVGLTGTSDTHARMGVSFLFGRSGNYSCRLT